MPPALSGYDFTPAQLHARNNEPAVTMFTGADGNLYPAGHPVLTQQDAILSDDTDKTGAYLNSLPTAREEAAAEAHRRKMLTPSAEMYGNAMQVGGNSNLPANDPEAVYMSLVKRYLDEGFGQKEAEAKAEAQMEKSRLQLLKENAGALASSINTSVLAAGSDGSGSNRLTNLLSGLSRDAIGFAKDVRKNGISVTYNGNEIFAVDGQGDTARIDEGTAAAINDANNSSTEQDPTAITGPFMGGYGQDSLPPPVPALASPNESGTGNGTGNTDSTVPALTQPTQSTVRSTTGGYTGNARGSALPDMQIGLNERLMRMGAAGLAAGGQGSLAQMGAMFGASADVNQANRQAEMEAFGIEEERRQAHAARVAALAASKNKGAGGGDMDKLKDFQAKNFGFYNRGVEAEKALMDTAGMGTDLWEKLKSNVPLFGNALVDPKYQRYDQARRNFVNAVLRRESGAVISDAEFDNANIQYFPQFGDSEETLQQKQRNRRTTMEGIRMGAGPSIFYTPAYPMAVPTDQGGGASNDQETEDLVKKYTN